MANLFELTLEQQNIESALYENEGELTPELEKAMGVNQENLLQKVDSINLVMRHMESQSDFLDKEIKRLQALKKTADNGQKRLKAYILSVMNLFEKDKLEGTTFKIFKRKTKSLEVNEEVLLFDHLTKLAEFKNQLPDYIELDYKVAKSVIKANYNLTNELPAGCSFEEKESLTIK